MVPKKGAQIIKGDPVARAAKEGALDQNINIGVDEGMSDLVLLDSVKDENDIFARCPVKGSIDFDKQLGKDTLKALLEKISEYTGNVFLNPTGEGFNALSEVVADRFAVDDAKWIDDPKELIWRSALLAQLQAKLNAVTHFVKDPAALDFVGTMSDEDKKIVAQRARQLAAELQDEALNEIDSKTDESTARLRQAVENTKDRFMRYTVTTDDAIQEGGFTEGEVNELFQGGE
ncbi:MAG: hypothetical protein GTO42_08675 [Candidatus Latescibacteria bacterium]|nr:hypothetical protein [Candidatus Latescibacterota bacterium]NIO29034.1 hypothetical protein [Candidatus Latescibacterota bacterium]NIO56659.1 hypothetical protein [Candidatus Latescibacterota bacterium]NIT02242.1 hypothetical protein [Candidatus Latescibacterota bacterium]NIT39127.1 hypothetical protein [Candidatus Latescibacterota bacterium]